MKTIAVSKFKATCLALLEKVLKTGQPILVTKQGKPLAQILPPPPIQKTASWLGCGKGTARIAGDLTKPVVKLDEWGVLK